MNVLSLFDGISCVQIALERAGIKVDKYYANGLKVLGDILYIMVKESM